MPVSGASRPGRFNFDQVQFPQRHKQVAQSTPTQSTGASRPVSRPDQKNLFERGSASLAAPTGGFWARRGGRTAGTSLLQLQMQQAQGLQFFNGITVASPEANAYGPASNDPMFLDALFDKGKMTIDGQQIELETIHQDDQTTSRIAVSPEGKMYTETSSVVDFPPEAVVQKLRGSWDWWDNGIYENRKEWPHGKINYDLWPATPSIGEHDLHVGIQVNETMHMPKPLPEPKKGVRIYIDLKGHVNGPAYFDVEDLGNGRSRISGRFAGTTVGEGIVPKALGLPKLFSSGGDLKLATARAIAENHLLAERGDLGPPLPKGTGLPGMFAALKAEQPH